MEFSLLVKGANSVGFFAFFLKMDPGFEIYVGNIKVFNFVQHGINNEVEIVLLSLMFFISAGRNGTSTG